MPPIENRRNFRRFVGQFVVTYSVPGRESRSAKCRDLSAGGIKLEVPEEIVVGTEMNIELSVANPLSGKLYRCPGKVVWSQTEKMPRMVFVAGVAFHELFLDISQLM
ncbi:MAG: PilZ domain-containing protein [candidate division FCPU426 bacterium]